MNNLIKLPFINSLQNALKNHPNLIQVIIGPRQVGKTTGIQQFLAALEVYDFRYVSADGPLAKSGSWLEEQWISLSTVNPSGLLVIDEIQKVEGWSETVKLLWDRQKQSHQKMKLILLGSSSIGIQKGLSESLTGRFFLHKVHQWNLAESMAGYGIDFEKFLTFGGYPGSYGFVGDRVQWLNYVKESIVETVIGRDILQLARVKSPALFRQSFEIACSYGGQEISYTKLLGQLQDKGNVELIKHYLELFEGAFLLRQLFKFSHKAVISRSSSPKILPLCPALYSITLDAEFDSEARGRALEIAVGCELARLPGRLCYWREGNLEVDFVYEFGRNLSAIEVKSGRKKSAKGLSAFTRRFPTAKALIVTPENFQEVIGQLTKY